LTDRAYGKRNARELRSEEGRLKGQAKRSERLLHRRSFCSLCFLDLMTSLQCGGSSTALLALLAFLGLMTSLECGGSSTALSFSFSLPVLAFLGLMTSLECGGSSTAPCAKLKGEG
jgi:hypothetical protein